MKDFIKEEGPMLAVTLFTMAAVVVALLKIAGWF